MIEIRNLRKRFKKNQVLKGIDLDFRQPGITAILGPNGSGKTTLMKSILGMVIPDEGTITFEGRPIKNEWDYRRSIDYLPQIARFPENLKVRELIRFVKELRGDTSNEDELIRFFGLEPYLDLKTGHLSGGTRQKVNIVLALMYDSPVIIMDEPTSGLDPVALIRLKELIRREKKRGKIIIITTHIMSFVEEMADELIFILDGNIHFRGDIQSLQEKYRSANLEHAIAAILEKKELNGTSKVPIKSVPVLETISMEIPPKNDIP